MRNKRRSKILNEADARIAALRSIAPRFDFGKTLTMPGYVAKANETRDLLANLNALEFQTANARDAFKRSESELGTMSSRLVNAVGIQFGTRSAEYGMAGGTPPAAHRKSANPPPDHNPAPPSTPTPSSTPTPPIS